MIRRSKGRPAVAHANSCSCRDMVKTPLLTRPLLRSSTPPRPWIQPSSGPKPTDSELSSFEPLGPRP